MDAASNSQNLHGNYVWGDEPRFTAGTMGIQGPAGHWRSHAKQSPFVSQNSVMSPPKITFIFGRPSCGTCCCQTRVCSVFTVQNSMSLDPHTNAGHFFRNTHKMHIVVRGQLRKDQNSERCGLFTLRRFSPCMFCTK